MRKNLQMVDVAVLDPRSIPAMLRGTGNGCEKVWLRFEQQHPEITDQEALIALFTREVRYGRVGKKYNDRRSQQHYGWLVFITLLIII
jgi:hypothetical protein